MKILYLDCAMGAAGDMLSAALYELMPEKETVLAELNGLGIPGVAFRAEPAEKCGILGTHMTVTVNGEEEAPGDDHRHDPEHDHDHRHDSEHDHHHDSNHDHDPADDHHHHHHSHRSLHEVSQILNALPVSVRVREQATAVYRRIAAAESHAHGVPVSEIHFHEVGTMDAIADVTAFCLLMEKLAPDRVVVSPIHVGSGQVRCAHGILPVPAPATAWLLKGVPTYGGEIRGELCTPTGAALLTQFADSYGPMPCIRTEAVGYGMGRKDFPASNCVRAFLGESEEEAAETADEVLELSCNLDDMTPESIGFAMNALLDAGALDVWTSPIGMKKNRPGVMLSALCKPEQRETLVSLFFRHTTTLGVRENRLRRSTLTRRTETVQTELGPVRRKTASGFGVTREKYEYVDLAALAKARGCSLEEIKHKLP